MEITNCLDTCTFRVLKVVESRKKSLQSRSVKEAEKNARSTAPEPEPMPNNTNNNITNNKDINVQQPPPVQPNISVSLYSVDDIYKQKMLKEVFINNCVNIVKMCYL